VNDVDTFLQLLQVRVF